MTDPDPLLAAIRRTPDDRTLRLAYADWLDERADPRGELVRVCEAMRDVPVFADEYWRLKTRRNELRLGCTADWLAGTGYDGSRYDPIFRDGMPSDWKGRWRLVREFTERWHGLPMPDIGGRQVEIRETEQRLGRTLPPSVREYVAYAHDVFPRPDYHVVHRDPYRMEWVEGQPALALMEISEGGVLWVVRDADLGLDDPPVYAYCWAENDDTVYVPSPERPDPEAESVSEFVLGFTTGYKPYAGVFSATVHEIQSLQEQLAAAFPVSWPVGPDGTSYEAEPGIMASVYPERWGRSGFQLHVHVRQGLTWEAVPEFLWSYAHWAHGRSGMFLSQEDVEDGLRHWGANPPEGVMREAVPPMRTGPRRRPWPPPPPPAPGHEGDDIPF